jgi:hypothetical protein
MRIAHCSRTAEILSEGAPFEPSHEHEHVVHVYRLVTSATKKVWEVP